MAQHAKKAPPSRQSVAYDYARVLPRQEEQNQPMQVHKGKARPKVPYGKYTAIVCVVFAALLVIVFNYMKVTELTRQNADLKAQLEELESDGNALDAKKEQIFNLTYVENRAKNALGMMKSDKSQLEYVDLSEGDSVEIPEEETQYPAFLRGLIKSFNAVVEYLN